MDQWLVWAKEGGAILSPFLLGALFWMNGDRNRLLEALSKKDTTIADKDEKLASVSERSIVLMTKIETFLFQSGRPA